MSLHRELFNDLPLADVIRPGVDKAIAQQHNADGFYNLVQCIAEQYGDEAYAIAEQVFQEMGLQFDPVALRAIDNVRRVDYNFMGPNIYAVQVRLYAPEMASEVVRLHNQQMRLVSRAALLDGETFTRCIEADLSEHNVLLVAVNEGGQVVGFVHCMVDGEVGSVEMLNYSHGRIYGPTAKALLQATRDFFAGQGVREVRLLAGRADYPFYSAVPGDRLDAISRLLPHIAVGLRGIVTGQVVAR